jgi:hypothetical protein
MRLCCKGHIIQLITDEILTDYFNNYNIGSTCECGNKINIDTGKKEQANDKG